MVCDLCEQEKGSYRSAMFGGKKKCICPECLGQWQIHEEQVTKRTVVLRDRFIR